MYSIIYLPRRLVRDVLFLPLCRNVRSQILRPVLGRFALVSGPAQVGRRVLREIRYYVLVFRYALAVGAVLKRKS